MCLGITNSWIVSDFAGNGPRTNSVGHQERETGSGLEAASRSLCRLKTLGYPGSTGCPPPSHKDIPPTTFAVLKP